MIWEYPCFRKPPNIKSFKRYSLTKSVQWWKFSQTLCQNWMIGKFSRNLLKWYQTSAEDGDFLIFLVDFTFDPSTSSTDSTSPRPWRRLLATPRRSLLTLWNMHSQGLAVATARAFWHLLDGFSIMTYRSYSLVWYFSTFEDVFKSELATVVLIILKHSDFSVLGVLQPLVCSALPGMPPPRTASVSYACALSWVL